MIFADIDWSNPDSIASNTWGAPAGGAAPDDNYVMLRPDQPTASAASNDGSGGGFNWDSLFTSAASIVSSIFAPKVQPATPTVPLRTNYAPPATGLSTGAMVGIGVGALALVGTTIAIASSSRRRAPAMAGYRSRRRRRR